MTIFDLQAFLVSQGANKHQLGRVNEALTAADQLPVWGFPERGAQLTTDHVVAFLLGATAADPAKAPEHVTKLSALQRPDGRTLAEQLKKVLTTNPGDVWVNDVIVAMDGSSATIRYQRTLSDVFYGADPLTAFTQSCVIRNSVLQQLAMKIQNPTGSGWTEPKESLTE